jgi:hypothetical protein
LVAAAVPAVSWKPNMIEKATKGDWIREYNITDHLGSVVLTVRQDDLGKELKSMNYFDVSGNMYSCG